MASASASLVTEQLDLRNADMPEDVPKSPPGKETCLESTTQEPQVKVDSAADDPGSLSERNKDLGAEEWTQSMLADIMRQSGNGAGEECVVQKPETNDSEPGKEAQEAQAIEVGPSRQGSMPADSGPSAVRSKVVASLGESLMKAATEWGDNLKVEKPDILNQDLAKTIEQELYSLYGSVGKEYRAKFRSLHFNLKDPHNPQLRGRVIAGEVLPYDLVRMSAIELASKELNEWRNKKAAEFEKAVILDAVTAAKYSTAAAAEVQEKLKESGKVEVVGRSHTIEPSETADNVATENLPAESPHVDKESPPELPEISNLNAAIVPSLGQTRVANIASLRAVGAVTNTTTITSYPEAPQEHVSQSGGIAGSLSPSSDPEIRSPSLSPSISSTPEVEIESFGHLVISSFPLHKPGLVVRPRILDSCVMRFVFCV